MVIMMMIMMMTMMRTNNILIRFQWFGVLLVAVVGLLYLWLFNNHSSTNCAWWSAFWSQNWRQNFIEKFFTIIPLVWVHKMIIFIFFIFTIFILLLSLIFPLLVITVIIRRIMMMIMTSALISLCGCGLFVVLVTHCADRQWDHGVHRDPSLHRPIWVAESMHFWRLLLCSPFFSWETVCSLGPLPKILTSANHDFKKVLSALINQYASLKKLMCLSKEISYFHPIFYKRTCKH